MLVRRQAALLLASLSFCAGQSVCSSVNFLIARTVNLKPSATSHINVLREADGSYTGYEVTDASPYRVIATTPHFERQFAACLPHTLPASPARTDSLANAPGASSQLQAFVILPSGNYLVANVYGSIQFDVFDPHLNLVSETTFTSPVFGDAFFSLELADLNADGKPDLLALSSYTVNVFGIATTGVALWTFLGNGDGTFQPGVRQGLYRGPFCCGVASLAVGDLNGDGKPDVAILLGFESPYLIALGNGDGTFTLLSAAALQQANSNPPPNSVALADFNGDGKLDLVMGPFSTFDQIGVGVAMGNGDGTFQPPVLFSARTTPARGQIAVRDVNGDGIPDIVTGAGSILLGDGKGGFPTRRDYALNANGSVILGDFDGDGNVDIIVGNGSPGFLSGNSTYSTLRFSLARAGALSQHRPLPVRDRFLCT